MFVTFAFFPKKFAGFDWTLKVKPVWISSFQGYLQGHVSHHFLKSLWQLGFRILLHNGSNTENLSFYQDDNSFLLQN